MTSSELEEKQKMLGGDIDFNDSQLAGTGTKLSKNLFHYGFKGLLNFGRRRTSDNAVVEEAVKRVSQHGTSIWISWSFLIIPTSAMSYLLWNAPKYPSFNSVIDSLI